MPGQKSNAHQVSSLGETPAEARRRMQTSGGAEASQGAVVEQSRGTEVKGPLRPEHLAAIEAAEGGFQGGPVSGGVVEESEDRAEAPSPTKAMETIRQLSQDKITAISERDAALTLVDRYKAKYGELD